MSPAKTAVTEDLQADLVIVGAGVPPDRAARRGQTGAADPRSGHFGLRMLL